MGMGMGIRLGMTLVDPLYWMTCHLLLLGLMLDFFLPLDYYYLLIKTYTSIHQSQSRSVSLALDQNTQDSSGEFDLSPRAIHTEKLQPR